MKVHSKKPSVVCLSLVFLWAGAAYSHEESTNSDSSLSPESNSKHICGKIPRRDSFGFESFAELTPIAEVVQYVAKNLQINLMLDRNVSGKISIIQNEPKTSNEACEIFLSALDNLNLTLVDQEHTYSVQKIRNAVKNNLPTYAELEQTPSTSQWVRKVYRPQYAHVEDLAQKLRKFTGPYQILADIPSNSLLISGTGHKIREIERLLTTLDAECDLHCQERSLKAKELKRSSK